MPKDPLVAFLAVLFTIIVLVIAGAVIQAYGGDLEKLGIGMAITDLIGVIGTFRPKTPGNTDN